MPLNRLQGWLNGNTQEKDAGCYCYCCLSNKLDRCVGCVFECQCSSSTVVQWESLRYCVNVWSVFSCDTAAFLRVREQLQGKQGVFLCCCIKVRSFVHLWRRVRQNLRVFNLFSALSWQL